MSISLKTNCLVLAVVCMQRDTKNESEQKEQQECSNVTFI